MVDDHQISLAITGASGAPYAARLLSVLNKEGYFINLMISDAARIVIASEMNISLPANPEKIAATLIEKFSLDASLLKVWSKDNWFSPVASGSSAPSQMIICPCSTGTLSAIATGASNNLIERAADVVLKEKGTLIVVPRETPYSTIHLENMLTLARAGATILPASPGFYHQPQEIEQLVDFIIGRIFDHLKIKVELGPRWGYVKNTSE
ncbi:MAG: UbiX family flavin prenyltransferase [Gammaproteobacteria bacterium]|nr:UbiX family flavin prenyltransferase [Gammaproteobacteria bacterium]